MHLPSGDVSCSIQLWIDIYYMYTELGDSLLFTQLLATHYLECQSKKFILLKCLIQKSKASGLRGVDMYRYPRLPKTLGIWGSI